MTGSELQERQAGAVPALRRDTSQELNAEDLAFPRLYIGQAISNAVVDGNVGVGDIFTAQDSDDPDPTVLAKSGDEKGVVFHVLGLRKGKSRSIDGVLETWQYDDPNVPADAWTTYTYFICIPDADDGLPYRYLLTKTGRPAAQKINTVLKRLQGEQPPYVAAFRLTTAERSGDKGRYQVPRVRPTEATEEGLAAAANLYGIVQENTTQVDRAAGEEPAI